MNDLQRFFGGFVIGGLIAGIASYIMDQIYVRTERGLFPND